jgi:transposase
VTTDEKDARIAELEAELAAKGARLVELEDGLAAKAADLAAKAARIAEFEQQVAALSEELGALRGKVEELTEKLNRNSRNSHLPPSSDPPGSHGEGKRGKGKGKGKGKRKRGGQPGHRGSYRQLLPPDQVDEIQNLFPQACENCCEPLPETPDPEAKRYQHIELPPIKPHVTETRRHTVECPRCHHKTCAPYDPQKIPSSPFGPRLMATIALLTGVYYLSRRVAVELLLVLAGVRLSVGALSSVEDRVGKAVAPAVDEAWQEVEKDEVKHTDGTSWLQAGVVLSLWTIATTTATVYKIVAKSSKDVLRPLYGALRGILVSDRAKALGFWAMERRQICWAHLLRRFVSFSERDGPAGAFGLELLEYTALLFEYWHDFKEGRLSRAQFQSWMAPVRRQVEVLLERAVAANIQRLSGSCADILKHRDALWTFVDHDGVEPTNNHAELELRAFVLWRKRSFGSKSERGNRFAENLMTVARTARKQNRNVLEFLTACCEAQLAKTPAPSLIAREATEAVAA